MIKGKAHVNLQYYQLDLSLDNVVFINQNVWNTKSNVLAGGVGANMLANIVRIFTTPEITAKIATAIGVNLSGMGRIGKKRITGEHGSGEIYVIPMIMFKKGKDFYLAIGYGPYGTFGTKHTFHGQKPTINWGTAQIYRISLFKDKLVLQRVDVKVPGGGAKQEVVEINLGKFGISVSRTEQNIPGYNKTWNEKMLGIRVGYKANETTEFFGKIQKHVGPGGTYTRRILGVSIRL